MSSRTPSHLLPALDSDVEDGDQTFMSDFEDASLARPLSQLPPVTVRPTVTTVASSASRQDGLAPRYRGTPDGAVEGAWAAHGVNAASALVPGAAFVSDNIVYTFGYRHLTLFKEHRTAGIRAQASATSGFAFGDIICLLVSFGYQ